MRDVKHILLPTDFSENSRTALPAAASLARRFNAVLHFLHVVLPIPRAARWFLAEKNIPIPEEEVLSRCEKNLRKLASEIGDGVRSEFHVAEGSPAEEIQSFVSEHRVDLVILSTKGHSGLKRYMLGSTAERVVRTAECPVLVVRELPSTWDKLTKIVVPTDLSDLSKLAIEEAVELARPSGAQVLLVHVLEETDYAIGHVLKGHGLLDIREQTHKGTQLHLDNLQKETIGASVPSTTLIREGVPSATIADLAEEESADLIVVANHGRQGLKRFVVGSTAERVARVASCSVLVVKERE